MFRLCIIVLALLLATPALADTQVLFEAGPWVLYGGTSNSGHPLCGMRVSDNNGSRTIHIKYFAGDDHLTIQMFKTSWQVPSGTRLAVTMRMDANPVWTARAYGEADHIEFTIPIAGVDNFAREFRYSGQMRIAFPEGSEAPWIASLAGTNIMLDRFVACIRSIRNAPGPGGPSQPYSAAPEPPSQPFGGQPGPAPGPSAGGDFHKRFDEPGSANGGGGGPSFGGGQPYRGTQPEQPAPQAPAPPSPSEPAPGSRI